MIKKVYIGSMDSMVAYLKDQGFNVTKEYQSKEKRYRFTISQGVLSIDGYFVYPDKDGISLEQKSVIMKYFCDRLIADFLFYHGDETAVSPSSCGVCPITKVIFNDPATIVFWSDGTKTVVKTQNGETFDPEKGLVMAISKRVFGNKGNYYNHISKWVDKYNEEQEALRKLRGVFDRINEGMESLCEKLSKTNDEKPMTFKEKLQKEHPASINERFFGGCSGCPYDYGYMENTNKNKACHEFSDTGKFVGFGDESCTKCWNRIIPKDSDA